MCRLYLCRTRGLDVPTRESVADGADAKSRARVYIYGGRRRRRGRGDTLEAIRRVCLLRFTITVLTDQ